MRISYRKMLRNRLLVQSFQTGTLLATGDILAQTIIDKNKISNIKLSRTKKYFILGAGLLGPVWTVWYKILPTLVTKGTNKAVIVKKLALDQFIFAPIMVFMSISTLNILEGKNLGGIRNELSHKFINILTTGYCVWPFVQIVNFAIVPLKYQVRVVQLVSLFWNCYFCWKTQQKIQTDFEK